MMFQLLCSK